jgi:hypothetical protein
MGKRRNAISHAAMTTCGTCHRDTVSILFYIIMYQVCIIKSTSIDLQSPGRSPNDVLTPGAKVRLLFASFTLEKQKISTIADKTTDVEEMKGEL